MAIVTGLHPSLHVAFELNARPDHSLQSPPVSVIPIIVISRVICKCGTCSNVELLSVDLAILSQVRQQSGILALTSRPGKEVWHCQRQIVAGGGPADFHNLN